MTTDSAVLSFLQQRTSSPRLCEPGPGDDELEEMLLCAVRSPDHAWLRPWRFVSIRGERRKDFGELLLKSLLRRNPDADEAARQKALNAPLRAPLVIAVMVSATEHPKVPVWEQRLSAGCAAYGLVLAAEALGYAAVWRTGSFAEDPALVHDLGGSDNEQFVGFIYVGSRDCPAKPIPDLTLSDFHRVW